MKKLLFALGLFTPTLLHGQNCGDHLWVQFKKVVEESFYTKKGEPIGQRVITIANVTGNVNNATSVLLSDNFNKKGELVSKTISNVFCDRGIMKIDLNTLIPEKIEEQYKDLVQSFRATEDYGYLEYPLSILVGDKLPDASLSSDLRNKSQTAYSNENNNLINKQSLSLSVTKRVVVGQDSITTLAGKFDCFKITYKAILLIQTPGNGIIATNDYSVNLEGTEWFAPKIGAVVKRESRAENYIITAISTTDQKQ